MKGRWQSNINVCFPVMYSQKWNCYFQNRIIVFCLPVPTLIFLWEINIFPGSVCLFCCSEICGLILGIHKSLTDTWRGKLGLRPSNSQKKEYINWIFLAVQPSSAKNTQSQIKWRLTYALVSYACSGIVFSLEVIISYNCLHLFSPGPEKPVTQENIQPG